MPCGQLGDNLAPTSTLALLIASTHILSEQLNGTPLRVTQGESRKPTTKFLFVAPTLTKAESRLLLIDLLGNRRTSEQIWDLHTTYGLPLIDLPSISKSRSISTTKQLAKWFVSYPTWGLLHLSLGLSRWQN